MSAFAAPTIPGRLSARERVACFWSLPASSSFVRWWWTAEVEASPTAWAISRTLGGYPCSAECERTNARMRSALCWSCFVIARPTVPNACSVCQVAPILAAVPLDGAALRDTALDYTIRTLWALVVAVVALVVARAVRATAMRSLARHRAHANATVLLGNLAQVLVLSLGLLAILAIYTQGAFGWILTSFSVIGIVVGLSLQDILKNFFAGLWVLVERPFRIGDTIEVAGHTGEVREISFRTTQLQIGRASCRERVEISVVGGGARERD